MAKIRNSLPIKFDEINGLINRYNELNANIEEVYKPTTTNPVSADAAKTFISSLDFNSFVFDRDSLQRLLDSSSATHIVVIMGAHTEDKTIEADINFDAKTFKENEFTLLSVACIEKNGELFVVNDLGDIPGTEWPPKAKALKLEKEPVGGLSVDENEGLSTLNFKFIESK